MKMAILQRGSPAPEVHHFRPLMMKWLPSRTILASMFVASDEATAGSVIAKHDRISPASNGLSQRSFRPGGPYRASPSILPVPRAAQPDTSRPLHPPAL